MPNPTGVENLTSSDFEVKKPKILFFDIETAPNLGYVWGRYEQNVKRRGTLRKYDLDKPVRVLEAI